MDGLFETNVPNYEKYSGKVRDLYSCGDSLYIMVTTDRISAFDYVFPKTVIPHKGKILQALSLFWVETLGLKYHLISIEQNHLPSDFRGEEFVGRTMLVEKAEVIPFECVVRGYLCGSAWQEYKTTGAICGNSYVLPEGLKENQQFPKPIFSPATKAKVGHDENVSVDYMAKVVGWEITTEIEALSTEIYMEAAQLAWSKGIIIADTKFEWGVLPQTAELILIDEVLTPDSSRFWSLAEYKLGGSINSFDKQFLRDWISNSGWDKQSEPPSLPQKIIDKTSEKYVEAYEKIVGQTWK